MVADQAQKREKEIARQLGEKLNMSAESVENVARGRNRYITNEKNLENLLNRQRSLRGHRTRMEQEQAVLNELRDEFARTEKFTDEEKTQINERWQTLDDKIRAKEQDIAKIEDDAAAVREEMDGIIESEFNTRNKLLKQLGRPEDFYAEEYREKVNGLLNDMAEFERNTNETEAEGRTDRDEIQSLVQQLIDNENTRAAAAEIYLRGTSKQTEGIEDIMRRYEEDAERAKAGAVLDNWRNGDILRDKNLERDVIYRERDGERYVETPEGKMPITPDFDTLDRYTNLRIAGLRETEPEIIEEEEYPEEAARRNNEGLVFGTANTLVKEKKGEPGVQYLSDDPNIPIQRTHALDNLNFLRFLNEHPNLAKTHKAQLTSWNQMPADLKAYLTEYYESKGMTKEEIENSNYVLYLDENGNITTREIEGEERIVFSHLPTRDSTIETHEKKDEALAELSKNLDTLQEKGTIVVPIKKIMWGAPLVKDSKEPTAGEILELDDRFNPETTEIIASHNDKITIDGKEISVMPGRAYMYDKKSGALQELTGVLLKKKEISSIRGLINEFVGRLKLIDNGVQFAETAEKDMYHLLGTIKDITRWGGIENNVGEKDEKFYFVKDSDTGGLLVMGEESVPVLDQDALADNKVKPNPALDDKLDEFLGKQYTHANVASIGKTVKAPQFKTGKMTMIEEKYTDQLLGRMRGVAVSMERDIGILDPNGEPVVDEAFKKLPGMISSYVVYSKEAFEEKENPIATDEEINKNECK